MKKNTEVSISMSIKDKEVFNYHDKKQKDIKQIGKENNEDLKNITFENDEYNKKKEALENFNGTFIEDVLCDENIIPKGAKVDSIKVKGINEESKNSFDCKLNISIEKKKKLLFIDCSRSVGYQLDCVLDINTETNELLDWCDKEVIAR